MNHISVKHRMSYRHQDSNGIYDQDRRGYRRKRTIFNPVVGQSGYRAIASYDSV